MVNLIELCFWSIRNENKVSFPKRKQKFSRFQSLNATHDTAAYHYTIYNPESARWVALELLLNSKQVDNLNCTFQKSSQKKSKKHVSTERVRDACSIMIVMKLHLFATAIGLYSMHLSHAFRPLYLSPCDKVQWKMQDTSMCEERNRGKVERKNLFQKQKQRSNKKLW